MRRGVSADAVSYASVVASAGAGGMFLVSGRVPWLLLVAPGLCLARLWFNMLDGMVAIAAGTASRRGEILNELPDRVSDVLVFAGVAHSGLAHPAAGWSRGGAPADRCLQATRRARTDDLRFTKPLLCQLS